MQEEFDFLTPSTNSIRKSLKGIEESYGNYWDILAELIQNSVDAIRRAEREDGKIAITIDQQRKSIRVKDNGSGIIRDKIKTLLSPFSTDKENDYNTIGEKGVGLKFVIFQGDYFELITRAITEQDTSIVTIKNAHHWLNNKSLDIENEMPKLQLESLNIEHENAMQDSGCSVYIECAEFDDDAEEDSYLKLFKMPPASLEFIIRTKTAIGNTLPIIDYDDRPPISISLTVINYKGEQETLTIPYRFFSPIDRLREKDSYDIDDFKKWLQSGDYSDSQKRNQLRDKIITQSGVEHSGHTIKYWSCFLPQRRIWNDLSVNAGLITEADSNDQDVLQDKSNELLQSGIFTSVKGMPTGISVEHPSSGYAGYWSNIFIIFEDDTLKFDIGRKSISGQAKKIYKKIAKKIFEEYLKYVTKYIAGDIDEPGNPKWNRDEIIKEIEQLPDLNIGKEIVNFEKLPSDQEASVAAIFYELVGAKKMNFMPIISGYKNRYDLYAKLDDHYCIVEFKSHLKNIIKDFDDSRKMSDELDFIVCWDVNDDDIATLHQYGIEVTSLDNDSAIFNNTNDLEIKSKATHKITVPASNPVYVIDLKKILQDL